MKPIPPKRKLRAIAVGSKLNPGACLAVIVSQRRGAAYGHLEDDAFVHQRSQRRVRGATA